MIEQWNVYESFQALIHAGPYHLALEAILILWIVWLLAIKKQKERGPKFTKKEEEELLSEWNPEPLVVNPPDPNDPALSPRTIHGKIGRYVDLGTGKKLLNLATHSYLNLDEREEVKEASLQCLHKYGVGSCGPRGFYGTTQVHLELEDRLAAFFNCEMAVLYSYGFSTVASAIPAYAKSGDIIYVDESVNFAIQRALQASRSQIVYFRHNDTSHLEELLLEQYKLDKKDPKKAAYTRRFIVVEGIYINTGELCPLPQIVHLRRKYKLRLFVDESISFGTMGNDARGVTDHFNIPIEDVDMIIASLEYAGASTGGFCVGTKFVIDHQRLSGLGYCFSASLPPMLAASVIKVVDILETEGSSLIAQLHDRCKKMHDVLSSISPKVFIQGDVLSPVKHFRLRDSAGWEEDEAILKRIIEKAELHGLALVLPAYLRSREAFPLPASIRFTIHRELTDDEIKSISVALKDIVEEVLGEDEVLKSHAEEGISEDESVLRG